MIILAGDIGGTNTRLAIYELRGKKLYPLKTESFISLQYKSLDLVVKEFDGQHNLHYDYACFGIAGPVKNGCAIATNLKWKLDEDSLEKDLKLQKVKLINDLEANGHGINEIEAKDMMILNEGVMDITGGGALIAAGTGLGEAGLFYDRGTIKPFPSEGGHVGFAPRNELEINLLQYLQKEYGAHISYERILSGPGLYNIYKFFSDKRKEEELPSFRRRLEKEDPASVISQAAIHNEDKLSVAALDLFLSLYGSAAGNLALKFLATGGVYIGGGIAPKIAHTFMRSDFMTSFVNKGRMRPLLEGIPVQIILNDKTALLGAARVSATLAQNGQRTT